MPKSGARYDEVELSIGAGTSIGRGSPTVVGVGGETGGDTEGAKFVVGRFSGDGVSNDGGANGGGG